MSKIQIFESCDVMGASNVVVEVYNNEIESDEFVLFEELEIEDRKAYLSQCNRKEIEKIAISLSETVLNLLLMRDLILENGISDRARFIYCILHVASDIDRDTLAEICGYSVDTLRKYISELVKYNWIEVINEPFKKNKFKIL